MYAEARSALSIRNHVSILVVCCSLGGLLLSFGLVNAYNAIDDQSSRLNDNSLALRDFDSFADQVSTWFITTDQVLQGAADQVDSAVRQADDLFVRAEEVQSAPLMSAHAGRFAETMKAIRDIQSKIVDLGSEVGDSTHKALRWKMTDQVDALAMPLIEALEEVEDSIHAESRAASADLIEKREMLRSITAIAGPLYLLIVFFMWRWTSRTLVRPLQMLTKSARASMEEGHTVKLAPSGPQEVRQLTKQVSSLIHSLEVARDEMHMEAVETEALLQSVPAVLIGVSPNGEVLRWNEGASKALGLLPSQAIGRLLRECSLPWNDPGVTDKIADHVGIRRTITYTDLFYTDGRGQARILDATITPVDYGLQGSGFLFLGTDVSDQKSLEKQLRHAQKLESVGQLAAGVAHEINTPIQYVGHSVHFLKDAFEDLHEILDEYRGLRDLISSSDAKALEESSAVLAQIAEAEEDADLELLEEEVPGAIERAIEGIQRVSSIVVAMKQFAHPGGKEMAPADLNEALKTTLTVAKNEYRYVADTVEEFEDIPLVTCNQGDLNQVFLNLIVNAAHAIEDRVKGTEERGTITIRTRAAGDNVTIEVQDTGGGIPQELAERIFDPFFTTKEVGKGTGQGLSIVHSLVVEKHSGSIRYRSKLGEGTAFIITLPIRHAAAATPRRLAA